MLTRFAAIALTLAITTAASAADLPRYKLQPGQVLTYRNTSITHEQNDQTSGSNGQLRIVVAGQNGDGWNLIIFCTSNRWQGNPPEANTQSADQDVIIQQATLHPDGRVDPTDDLRININGYFFPLPQKPADIAGYTVSAPFGETLTITPLEHTDKQWTLDVKHDSPENAIYIATNQDKATIDIDRGLPIHIEDAYTQDYGFHQKGTGTTDLQSVETKAPAWAAQLWKDLDVLKKAETGYDMTAESLFGDETNMKLQLANAHVVFRHAKDNIHSPEILAQFDKRLQTLDQYQKSEIQDALDKAKILNQPAADWTLEKVGGGKLALNDLRGKVVVLDWWYRGCGWCMHAMPQVKQLAADYKNRGVVVLGMNVDSDEKDPAFVIDKMALDYPTLKTSFDFAKNYGVHGYPTLVIIDQQGIIRKLYIGYSPDLRKTVGDTLDTLLKG